MRERERERQTDKDIDTGVYFQTSSSNNRIDNVRNTPFQAPLISWRWERKFACLVSCK